MSNKELNNLVDEWKKDKLSANELFEQLKLLKIEWPEFDEAVKTQPQRKSWWRNIGYAALVVVLLILGAGLVWLAFQGNEQQATIAALETRVTEGTSVSSNPSSEPIDTVSPTDIPSTPTPEPVTRITGIEFINTPNRVYVGTRPAELVVQVEGENVEGLPLEFEVSPSDKAYLVQPQVAVVENGVARLLLTPSDGGQVTIRAKYDGQEYTSKSIQLIPRPDVQLEILQDGLSVGQPSAVAGTESIFEIQLTNTGDVVASELELHCNMPDVARATYSDGDFTEQEGELIAQMDELSSGGSIKKSATIMIDDGEDDGTFTLDCRVLSDDMEIKKREFLVAIVPPAPHAIVVEPENVDTGIGMTTIITATVTDASNSPMSGIDVSWEIESDDFGDFVDLMSGQTDASGMLVTNLTLEQVGDGTIKGSIPGANLSNEIPLVVRPTVEVENANQSLWAGPSDKYKRIGSLERDDIFVVIGKNDINSEFTWWQVRSKDEVVAWIHEKNVTTPADADGLTEVDPPPNLWTLKATSGDNPVSLYTDQELEEQIVALPANEVVELVESDDNSRQINVSLWIASENLDDDGKIEDAENAQICWPDADDNPNENACGTFSAEADGFSVERGNKKEDWVKITFQAWVLKDYLE